MIVCAFTVAGAATQRGYISKAWNIKGRWHGDIGQASRSAGALFNLLASLKETLTENVAFFDLRSIVVRAYRLVYSLVARVGARELFD